jgi:hypothetical protein
MSCMECTDMYSQHPKILPVWLGGQNAISSSYGIHLTKKNIPPESGRRAGRNGVGFVGFWALSFLRIFHALTGF